MCFMRLRPASDLPRLTALDEQAMASASPLTDGTSTDGPELSSHDLNVEPVSQQELNAWRRGFTPQAEIWNGRLAMLGLSVGLTLLLISRLMSHSPS